MLSLQTVGRAFEVPLKIIGNGSGTVMAVMGETDQTQIPSYVFVPPRQLARVVYPTALKPRHVVETPSGLQFIVAENGPSEHVEGILWQSLRMFRVTHHLQWTRRTKVIDPVTRLSTEGPPQNMGVIPLALEPTDREVDERRLSTQIEMARYLSAEDIRSDDLLGEHRVVRADEILGITIGMVTY
jgi:hypothetical protein